MKKLNEAFTPEVLKALQHIYVPNYSDNGCTPIIPSEEDLTRDKFGIILDDVILTVDDFEWYEENGTDRDFRYGTPTCFFSRDDTPDDVCLLLDTEICINFATRHLNDVKTKLDDIDGHEAKKTINDAIAVFDKATNSKEKLQIAQEALSIASDAFDDIDQELCITLHQAACVITDVVEEIAKAS